MISSTAPFGTSREIPKGTNAYMPEGTSVLLGQNILSNLDGSDKVSASLTSKSFSVLDSTSVVPPSTQEQRLLAENIFREICHNISGNTRKELEVLDEESYTNLVKLIQSMTDMISEYKHTRLYSVKDEWCAVRNYGRDEFVIELFTKDAHKLWLPDTERPIDLSPKALKKLMRKYFLQTQNVFLRNTSYPERLYFGKAAPSASVALSAKKRLLATPIGDNNTAPTVISSLPIKVWRNILSNLDGLDKVSARLTCKSFSVLVDNPVNLRPLALISGLPNEVWQIILSNLDGLDKVSARLTCKSFSVLVENPANLQPLARKVFEDLRRTSIWDNSGSKYFNEERRLYFNDDLDLQGYLSFNGNDSTFSSSSKLYLKKDGIFTDTSSVSEREAMPYKKLAMVWEGNFFRGQDVLLQIFWPEDVGLNERDDLFRKILLKEGRVFFRGCNSIAETHIERGEKKERWKQIATNVDWFTYEHIQEEGRNQ